MVRSRRSIICRSSGSWTMVSYIRLKLLGGPGASQAGVAERVGLLLEDARAELGPGADADRLVERASRVKAHPGNLLQVDHVAVELQPVKHAVELDAHRVKERHRHSPLLEQPEAEVLPQ